MHDNFDYKRLEEIEELNSALLSKEKHIPRILKKNLFGLFRSIFFYFFDKFKNISFLRRLYIKKFINSSLEKKPVLFNRESNNFFLDNEIKKILIFKLDHLGDFIISIPILKKIREDNIKSKITIVVGSWNKNLAISLNIFDEVFVWDYLNPNKSKIDYDRNKTFFKEVYDVFLNLRYGYELSKFDKYIKAKKKISYNRDSFNEFNYVNDIEFRTLKNTNNYYSLLALASPLINKQNSIKIGNEELFNFKNVNEKFIKLANEKYIVFAPFSNSQLRSLDIKKINLILKYLEKFNINVFLVSNKKISLKLNITRNLNNLSGYTNIDEYYYILKKASYVITVNSSAHHISSHYKVKNLTIFSGTHHPNEWASNNYDKIIYLQDFCSPCHASFASDCPYNLSCLKIDYEKLLFDNIEKDLKHVIS